MKVVRKYVDLYGTSYITEDTERTIEKASASSEEKEHYTKGRGLSTVKAEATRKVPRTAVPADAAGVADATSSFVPYWTDKFRS